MVERGMPSAAARSRAGEVRRDLGLMAVAMGALSLPPFAVALVREDAALMLALGPLGPLVALGLSGIAAARRGHSAERRGGSALATLALGWLTAGVLAGVPLALAAHLDPAPRPRCSPSAALQLYGSMLR